MPLFDWVGHVRVSDRTVHKMLIFVEEWRDTDKHFIKQNSQSPPIHCVIVALSGQHLGGQVLCRATKRPGNLVFVDLGGETEICQQQVAIAIEQDIFWLEVPVNDILLMEMAECDGHLSNHKLSLVVAEASDFDEMPEQLSALHKVHQEINSHLITEHVVHTHNERMVHFV